MVTANPVASDTVLLKRSSGAARSSMVASVALSKVVKPTLWVDVEASGTSGSTWKVAGELEISVSSSRIVSALEPAVVMTSEKVRSDIAEGVSEESSIALKSSAGSSVGLE